MNRSGGYLCFGIMTVTVTTSSSPPNEEGGRPHVHADGSHEEHLRPRLSITPHRHTKVEFSGRALGRHTWCWLSAAAAAAATAAARLPTGVFPFAPLQVIHLIRHGQGYHNVAGAR